MHRTETTAYLKSSIPHNNKNTLTLLRATTKGVLRDRSKFSDSIVCGSSPCIISTTRMAMSHNEDPLDLKLLKDSWPGVSMISRPGNFNSVLAN